jgi:uncharacterized protein (TIGR02145 family)
MTITTLIPVNSVTDADGNSYNTVTIGTQVWMKENLKTTKFNDGTDIPMVTSEVAWAALSTAGYCWYNNDVTTNKATYGALYNWYTVNTGKLCPTGWHVSADAERKTLEIYLGMTQAEADAIGWRGTDQGTQLKNTTGWQSGGNGNNTSGFAGLPGGARYGAGNFDGVGGLGYWWSSTETNSSNAWFCNLYYTNGNVCRENNNKQCGFSVRCLKDPETIVVAPAVSTQSMTSITSTSSTTGGNVSYDGGATVTTRGVCWSTSTNPTINNSKTTDGTGTGSFTSSITGLTAGITYFVRAYATNSAGTAYGNEIIFSTSIADIEGNNYKTVQIGSQLWMAENLKTTKFRDGSSISLISNNLDWGSMTTPSYCWYNNDTIANKVTYGALYNWYAVVSPNMLCPSGWKVPSDVDWTTLMDFLGGSDFAGDKLKEVGTLHWSSPNNGATNATGFTAIPSGGRGNDGVFWNLGLYSLFWSATSFSSTNAWYRSIENQYSIVFRYDYSKKGGFAVRCLKN